MEINPEKLMVGLTSPRVGKRLPAYQAFIHLCGTKDNELVWSDCATSHETKKFLQNLKTDLTSSKADEVYEAMGMCVCLLANPTFIMHVDSFSQRNIFDILINSVKENKEKKVTYRSLRSLAVSRFEKDIYTDKVEELLVTLIGIIQADDVQPGTINEALEVIFALLDSIMNTILELRKIWFPVTFSKMFHSAGKVRETALAIIGKVMEATHGMPISRSDLVLMAIPDLKAKYCKEMSRLLLLDCMDILRGWCVIVQLLGTDLHPKRSLINSLLEVLEKAFKIPKPEVRVEAFKCWHTLIDNFALDKNLITSTSRLQLLLAPLKANNAKTEEIARSKLLSWWHFALVLSTKKGLGVNFDLVMLPLLSFCFNSGSPSEGNKAGLSKRNLLMSGATASPGRAFPGLHIAGVEILAQILSTGDDISKYKFSIPIMEEPVLSSALFTRHHPLLMRCFREAIQTLNTKNDQQYTLGISLFHSLLTHIKAITAPDIQKKEAVEVVRELFNMLLSLENQSQVGDPQSLFVYKFFDLLILGNLALPKRILNSRQFHIAASGGEVARDVMCGTLSNHLVSQLCRPVLLHYSTADERFLRVWEAVLENSQPVTGKLGFLQAVIQELERAAPVLCPSNPMTLVHLWGAVVMQMVNYINETQTIDEGDGSEHDWSCVYSVLQFPLTHSIDALSCAESPVYQQIMVHWTELWEKFTNLTPLAVTAEPNCEVEHVARTLLVLCQEKLLDPPDVHAATYQLMAEVLALLTKRFRYAELGKTPAVLFSSPARPKKKPHPLHNLAASVELSGTLLVRALRMVSGQRHHVAISLCTAIANMTQKISETKPKYIQEFIKYFVQLMSNYLKMNPAAVFNSDVEARFIDMFRHLTNLIECHFHSPQPENKLVGEQLSELESLFITTLTSSNPQIVQEAQKLWESCFASTIATSDIPPSILAVLPKRRLSLAAEAESKQSDSMEDFVSASTKEKSPRKGSKLRSSSGTKSHMVYTPRASTPASRRKTKMGQADSKNKEFAVKVFIPNSKSTVREVEGIEQRCESRNASPFLSSVTPECDPQESFQGMAANEMLRGSPMKKTKKSQGKSIDIEQSTDKKAPTMESHLSVEEEKVGTETDKPSEVCPTDDSVLPKSTENGIPPSIIPEQAMKDLNRSDDCGTKSEGEQSVGGRGSARSKPKLSSSGHKLKNKSVSHSLESNLSKDHSSRSARIDEASHNLSPTRASGGKSKAGEGGGVRRYTSGDSDYTDEDLDAVLRTTSYELQKSFNEINHGESATESSVSTKIQHKKSILPLKKSLTDVPKMPTGATCPESTRDHQRISFMEVAVSPSIISDAKLVKKKPEVQITGETCITKQANITTVSETDSDDEIPSSLDTEVSSVGRSLLHSPKKNTISKMMPERISPMKSMSEENRNFTTFKDDSGTLKHTRKRKLFKEQEESYSAPRKKKRTEDSAQNCDNSDDSVIDLTSNSNSPNQSFSRKYEEALWKALRKNKSHTDQTLAENKENGKTTPEVILPKVTRSGRKIVAPNKDMPKPMTPSKKSRSPRSPHPEGNTSLEEEVSCTDRKEDSSHIRIVDSDDEQLPDLNMLPYTTEDDSYEFVPRMDESPTESDEEEEHNKEMVSNLSSSENISEKCVQPDDKTKQTEDSGDQSVTIIEDVTITKKRSLSEETNPFLEESETPVKKSVRREMSTPVVFTSPTKAAPASPLKASDLSEKKLERKSLPSPQKPTPTPPPTTMAASALKTYASSTKRMETRNACALRTSACPTEKAEMKELPINRDMRMEVSQDIVDVEGLEEGDSQLISENIATLTDASVVFEKEHKQKESDTSLQTLEDKEASADRDESLEDDEQVSHEETCPESPPNEEGKNQSEDSVDHHKASDESTPMECGQRLDGEVSYPVCRRRGTEILENSCSAEGEGSPETLPQVQEESMEGEEVCDERECDPISKEPEESPCVLPEEEKQPELEKDLPANNKEQPESETINVAKEQLGSGNVNNTAEKVDVPTTVEEAASPTHSELSESQLKVHEKDSVAEENSSVEVSETPLSPRKTDGKCSGAPVALSEPKDVTAPDPKPVEGEAGAPGIVPEVATETASPCAQPSLPNEDPEESLPTTRQQEEELSPDKSSRSRLKTAVSTPERHKHRGSLPQAGSRAALLVACAKQNIRNRGGSEGESPSNSVTVEGGRSRSLGSSPSRKGSSSRHSPAHSPDGRRRSLCDGLGVRPWVKHVPSPGASPSTSILKKTLLTDGLDGETPSPPPSKYRRVSFADPPVSDRVEIPPSPRTLKSIRAQKRLDMTHITSPLKDCEVQATVSQSSQEADSPTLLDWSQPLCPSLSSCQDKVEQVAQQLTSPAMLSGLLATLEELGVHTVGQLSQLTEVDISRLPVRAPKVASTLKVLREYEEAQLREKPPLGSPVMDEVEAQLCEMFGAVDREDKENLRPNQQDRLATKTMDTETREEGGSRSSHSGDIEDMLDMEDITPLDASPEDTGDNMKTLCQRASEEPTFLPSLVQQLDSGSRETLFTQLLHTLSYPHVLDLFFQYLKTRNPDKT